MQLIIASAFDQAPISRSMNMQREIGVWEMVFCNSPITIGEIGVEIEQQISNRKYLISPEIFFLCDYR